MSAYRVIRVLVKGVLRVYTPVHAIGVSNIPAEGGALIISNHHSNLDPVVVFATCPREMAFVAKKEVFSIPLVPYLATMLNAVPVDRENPDITAVKATLKALRGGLPVLITPEGTRSPTREMLPFKPGFLRLAQKSRVPLIPTAIAGTYELWPRHQRLPRPGRITIVYDRPVRLEDLQGQLGVDRSNLEEVSTWFRSKIAGMLAQYS